MPLSDIVIVLFFLLSSNSISTFGENFILLNFLSEIVKYLNLSIASEELDINSLKNISLFEYKE